MALEKKIIFKNGVEIQYHRIGDITLDNKKKILKVSVISYSSAEYRNQEKEQQEKSNRYEEIMDFILKENEKLEEERDIDTINSLSVEANLLVEEMDADLDLSVLKFDFEFENVDDLSMSNIYRLIEQEEMFIDSKTI